jgi:hypothetical protein
MPCHEHSRGSLGARSSHAGALLSLSSLLYRACASTNTDSTTTTTTAANTVPSPVCQASSFRRCVRVLARRRTRPERKWNRPGQSGPRLVKRPSPSSVRRRSPAIPCPTPMCRHQDMYRLVSHGKPFHPSQSARRKGEARAKIEEEKKRYNYKSMALGCERENRHRHCVVERRAGPRCCAAARRLASGSHSSDLAVAAASRRGRGEAKEIMCGH